MPIINVKKMLNSKYKQRSEGGIELTRVSLALSFVSRNMHQNAYYVI